MESIQPASYEISFIQRKQKTFKPQKMSLIPSSFFKSLSLQKITERNRKIMEHIRIIDLLKNRTAEYLGKDVIIKGWVRTKRGNKNVAFIALNDGSIIHSIQVVADTANFSEDLLKLVTTGACLKITGKLMDTPGQQQPVEIHATAIEVYGTADSETYPLQKKGHTLEFLRDIAHLRPRTNTFGAVLRIRHAMAFAVHKYFNDHGFYYLHTPIITG
jgi:asparaginyl-tRNA synthetase